MHDIILTLSCPDKSGIVAAVSTLIAQYQGSIIEANQHSEHDSQHFFMRVELRFPGSDSELNQFQSQFSEISKRFDMQASIHPAHHKKRLVVLVSKHDHCLVDILYRWRNGELRADIPCVISNHEDLRPYVEWHNIPYYYIPVSAENRDQAFSEISALYEKYEGDIMVLARYMQILPPDFCRHHSGKIINIHHSFLPSFSGAKPYHQAHEKGVKLIGATCHYVTEVLDAGPIVEQDVIRVGHHHSVDDMARLGRDVERQVLARGLRYHLEDRIFLHQNKTIVFE